MNPFEPWRPAELNVPPPLHASRPWRPPQPAHLFEEVPLLIEAVDPSKPPRKANGRSKPAGGAHISRLTPAVRLRSDQRIVLGMFFVLGTLGLVGLACLGATHLPRLLTALPAIALGFTIGISIQRNRDWVVRLGWMASGLALAALAGWFVPTTRGVSLWSAYRQVDELRVLPTGDVAGYTNGATARQTMVGEFPSFALDVSTAEQAWLRRTVDAAIENADQTREMEADKALANLQQLQMAVEHRGLTSEMQDELKAAQRRARWAKAEARQN